jgi:hypothetical protein
LHSPHRFGETATRLCPAAARQTVRSNRHLLDGAFLDALDLGAATDDYAGAGELVDRHGEITSD